MFVDKNLQLKKERPYTVFGIDSLDTLNGKVETAGTNNGKDTEHAVKVEPEHRGISSGFSVLNESVINAEARDSQEAVREGEFEELILDIEKGKVSKSDALLNILNGHTPRDGRNERVQFANVNQANKLVNLTKATAVKE